MKEPQWLLRQTVLATQERLLAEFGGLSGVRDAGLLDSALARRQQLSAYSRPSLFDLAAAYAYGLVRNHPSWTAISGLPLPRQLCSWN